MPNMRRNRDGQRPPLRQLWPNSTTTARDDVQQPSCQTDALPRLHPPGTGDMKSLSELTLMQVDLELELIGLTPIHLYGLGKILKMHFRILLMKI